MKTLGIDYGRSKIGLALGVGSFAEPFKVLRYTEIKTLTDHLKVIVKAEKIDKIIVGISEGAMALEIKDFVAVIRRAFPAILCETHDETLTSRDAQKLSIEAGVAQKKRHEMEDAYAASIMLQNYLDSNPNS